MQRHLGRLTHRTDKQQQADQGHPMPFESERPCNRFVGERRGRVEHVLIIQTAKKCEHCTDAQNEAKISNPINQEGFQIRAYRAFTFVPETDEEIRNEAYSFPPKKELQKVVGHDQHKHRESEERDVTEKPGIARIVCHVTDRIYMHHQ